VRNQMNKKDNILRWVRDEIKTDICEYVEYGGFGSVKGQLRLNSTLLEHMNYQDNKYIHIIRFENEPFTVYMDYSKDMKKLYIEPDYWNEPPVYKGVSQRLLNELTHYCGISNYFVSCVYYDYEEACLCIRECKSNINPQCLTDYELDYIAKKVLEKITVR